MLGTNHRPPSLISNPKCKIKNSLNDVNGNIIGGRSPIVEGRSAGARDEPPATSTGEIRKRIHTSFFGLDLRHKSPGANGLEKGQHCRGRRYERQRRWEVLESVGKGELAHVNGARVAFLRCKKESFISAIMNYQSIRVRSGRTGGEGRSRPRSVQLLRWKEGGLKIGLQ